MTNEIRDLYPDPPHSIAAGMNESSVLSEQEVVSKQEDVEEEVPGRQINTKDFVVTAPNSFTSAKDPQGL